MPPVSEVASLCLGEWSWGLMPASKIQRINAACKADNDNRGLESHPEVCKLASLGSSGHNPQNCTRDLVKHCLKHPRLAEALSSFKVKLKLRALKIVQRRQRILLPHKLFALIYEHHRENFTQAILGGSADRVRQFWEKMAENHPGYAAHELRDRNDHMTRCVPLSLHGDGVPISGQGRTYARNAY